MSAPIETAFIDLVNEHLGIARKISRVYCSDADDREDVFQEMMYQLWRSYPGFDERSKFSTWMYRVCLNTAIACLRKANNQRTERLTFTHQLVDQPDDPSAEKSIALLLSTIGELSPLNKAIILLYLDELSYDEIASVTGLGKSNVSVRLVRIKKELEIKIKSKINTFDDDNAG